MQQIANCGAELLGAAERGDVETVTRLLECGVDPNVRDVLDGTTALHSAALRGDCQIAIRLIQAGADVQASENNTQSSPLGIALLAGQLAFAELLLSNGGMLSGAEIATGLLDEARELGYVDIVDTIKRKQTCVAVP